jgi:glucose-6-phosphate isomerase
LINKALNGMKLFTEQNAWVSLKQHARALGADTLRNFDDILYSPASFCQLKTNNITLDFSKQRVDEFTLELLFKLAQERQLLEKIQALIRCNKINHGLKSTRHTALRSINSQPIFVDGYDITREILDSREKMWSISSQIRSKCWFGFSGTPITAIVNIGMGGSDLGPRFCINALSEYSATHLTYRFISDIDPNSFENAVTGLEPETTLFIISSKSFKTTETLYNTKKAFAWIGKPRHYKKHFIAITANSKTAQEFGIDNVLPIWDWVESRYAMCSAINLITCIAVGYERFAELLAGANSMDRHFHHSDLKDNLPVVMALIGLWNINFRNIPNLLLLIFAKQLEEFLPYLQKLDMESNGKSIDVNGCPVDYATGPIVWGGLGNQAQHSYYQLLCQGTHKLTADFISNRAFENDTVNSFCNAQIRVLSQGVPNADLNASIPGGMPINHISLSSCSPFCIGELIALYEHKIFTQGVLWNINSFDKPAIESAKRFHSISAVDLVMA